MVRNYNRGYSRRFKSCGVSKIFANYASKRQIGNQDTSKATPRAQLTKYLNEVATITLPSNGFEVWKQRKHLAAYIPKFVQSRRFVCFILSSVLIVQILGYMPQGVVFVPSFMLVRPKIVFSVRWSGNRTSWRSHCLENRDKAALLIHFKSKHSNFIDFNTKIYECYEVIFFTRTSSR